MRGQPENLAGPQSICSQWAHRKLRSFIATTGNPSCSPCQLACRQRRSWEIKKGMCELSKKWCQKTPVQVTSILLQVEETAAVFFAPIPNFPTRRKQNQRWTQRYRLVPVYQMYHRLPRRSPIVLRALAVAACTRGCGK